MKQIDETVQEQLRYLSKMGYTDAKLNHGEPDGYLKEQFVHAVSNVLESDKTLFEDEKMNVLFFGSYNNRQEDVLFNFHYTLDTYQHELTLFRVEASLFSHEEIKITLPITERQDLWTPDELYLRLSTLLEVYPNKKEEQEKMIFHTETIRMAAFLQSGGYNPHKDLIHHLRNTLTKQGNRPVNPTDFVLRQRIPVQGSVPIEISLHLRYIPQNTHIHLKSIHATQGETKRMYLNNQNSLPTLQAICTEFNRIQQNAIAQKIRDIRATTPQQKNKL